MLCCASILIPSFICSTYYDAGVDNFRKAYALLGRYAPAWASMTPAEVDAALAEVVPIVQDMLENLSTFPHIFGIAWTFWLIWIVYSYGVSRALGLIVVTRSLLALRLRFSSLSPSSTLATSDDR